MIQVPYTKPERYIQCPACNKGDYEVSHLPVGTETAWYCDECGIRFKLRVISEDAIACTLTEERKEKRIVTLRSEGPVTLIVEGMKFSGHDASDSAFFYNEHTCPTNYLHSVIGVISEEGELDPHGIFQFVSDEPWDDAAFDEQGDYRPQASK